MRKVLVPAALAIAAGAASASASAQEVEFADGAGYVGVEAGVVMPEDVDINATTTAGGVTVTGSGAFEFDTGYSVGALAGYRFTEWVTGEAELAYSQFDYDQVSGTLTVTNAGSTATVGGAADIDGDVSTVLGLVNVLVTPPVDDAGAFKPFIGGGLGFAYYDEEVDAIGGTTLNISNSETELAYQFKAGFDYAATEQVDVGASYSYIGADTGTDYTDDFAAHSLMARASFKF